MGKNNRAEPTDELTKVEEEWNFTNIPQEKLLLAEIYEYSREIKMVRNAFTQWLDSEAFIIRAYFSGDYDETMSEE